MKFPPNCRFERIVCAITIHPKTHQILTALMRPEAKNRLANERHLPGGRVGLNQAPEVAIRHHLRDKLGLEVEKVYPFITSYRNGTLKDENDKPIEDGRRYVTTYWYIIQPDIEAVQALRARHDCELVPDSERWVNFYELIDGSSEHCLGSNAAERTPYLDLQMIWPFGHDYKSAEVPSSVVGLQQVATT